MILSTVWMIITFVVVRYAYEAGKKGEVVSIPKKIKRINKKKKQAKKLQEYEKYLEMIDGYKGYE